MNNLIISDIHLNDVNVLYFKRILFPTLSVILKNYNIDEVTFLGDIFDDVTEINKVVLSLFNELMSLFNNKVKHIVVGNHDRIDKYTSIYDLMFLNDTFRIYNKLDIDGYKIYVPYYKDINELYSVFSDVAKYINKRDFDKYIIFSHNDIKDLYKFSNKFIDLSDLNILNDVFFFSGHNHRTFFKNKKNVKICNLGSSINLSFTDGCHHSIFGLIKNDNDIRFIVNRNNVKYYTYEINNKDDLNYIINNLNNKYIKYINFNINNVNVKISHELIDELRNKYNVVDVKIDYTFNVDSYDIGTDTTNSELLYDIKNITEILGLELSDFNSYDKDKIDVLFYLINRFIEDNENDNLDTDNFLNVINKLYLNDKKVKHNELVKNI